MDYIVFYNKFKLIMKKLIVNYTKRYFSVNHSLPDTNDAGKVMKKSISDTLYALRNLNDIKEFDNTLSND